MKELERHVAKKNIFVNGQYRFNLNEQRIMLLVVSKIAMNDKDFRPYRVDWSFLKKITKGGLKSADRIEKACIALKNKTVKIKDGTAIHGFGFLSGWKVQPGRYVEFRIDPVMRDLLLELLEEGRFTLYQLQWALALNSTYSIRLYEIFKSHQFKKQPVRIDLSELQWQLCVENKKLYTKGFDQFRRYILERSLPEINEKTDIYIQYTKILDNRKVTALDFYITDSGGHKDMVAQLEHQKHHLENGNYVEFKGQVYPIDAGCISTPQGAVPLAILRKLLKSGKIRKC